MKRCPQCSREYDASMRFCLDDGSELLYGPASDEPATAIQPPAEQTAEPLSYGKSTVMDTAVLSEQALPEYSRRSTSSAEYLVTEVGKHRRTVLMVAAAALAAMVGLGYFYYRSSTSGSSSPIAS